MMKDKRNFSETTDRLGSIGRIGTFALIMLFHQLAVGKTLDKFQYNPLPGDKVQLMFTLSEPVQGNPVAYSTNNPARIVLDFVNTKSNLKAGKPIPVGVGVVRDVIPVEANGKTRVVLSLNKMAQYSTQKRGRSFLVTIGEGAKNVALAGGAKSLIKRSEKKSQPTRGNQITHVDFKRGQSGEGQVVVKLTNPGAQIDVTEQSGKILVDFKGMVLPNRLRQRLDVTDFATQVTTIDATQIGNIARLVVKAKGRYEQMAYQFGDTFTLDIKEVVEKKESNAPGTRRVTFSGEKISLNFQNIEIRAVLQLIADFTGLNMVTTDNVTGKITLRLQNVPWDQALDIILRSKALGMRQQGNVIMVAPMSEIVKREKVELENLKDKRKLAPLYTQRVTVNYVKAEEIAELLSDHKNKEKNPILTKGRGSVQVFAPGNMLIIKDTEDNLGRIVGLVKELDQPSKQVLIESRIVIANNDFTRELGARAGVTTAQQQGSDLIMSSGSNIATDVMTNGAVQNIQNNNNFFPLPLPGNVDRLNWDVPATLPTAGKLALAILSSNFLVDLELSAIQAEGRGEVISNPRVITANQKEAVIQQGTEIPFTTQQGAGAITVEFKKAVLSLKVTPQITPDDRINLELTVNKDSVGTIFNGIPSIDTKSVSTQVLISNGETVVLGGIYEQTRRDQNSKVPVLGDLPILGLLFKNSTLIDNKSELLIFVTPKIIKDTSTAELLR